VATIHPSAVVDRRAEIDDDAEIGPHCVIDGPVTIGRGTRLIANVTLRGPLSIGSDNLLYPSVCIGFAPQDLKFDAATDGPGVTIGNGNLIREGVTIHRATGQAPTAMGDHNFLMANSHLGHDVCMQNHCMLANGALVGGHVQIGDRVILGGNAVVHQFCRLGRLCILAGIRGVIKDVPPFCTVYVSKCVGSLNYIGLRRAGYRQHIAPLKKAFEVLYRSNLPNAVAADRIEAELSDDPLCVEFGKFVREATRGLSPCGASTGDEITE
jgi:UDP-N-acetylglucosamine acyltransferase